MITDPPLVLVTWIDATTWHGACPVSRAVAEYHLATRNTVGYMLGKTTEYILLAHTLDEKVSDEVWEGADYTLIPRHWANKILKLETGEEL